MTIMKNKSTQELFGATSEGLSGKSSYATPTIKVVTFQVEHGFAGSPDPDPNAYNIGNRRSTPAKQGLQDFERETWEGF